MDLAKYDVLPARQRRRTIRLCAIHLTGLFLLLGRDAVSQSVGKFRSVDVYNQYVTGTAKDRWQDPDDIISGLHLQPTDSVAVISAQPGLLARRIAPSVANLYIVTSIPSGVAQLQTEALPNVKVILASGRDDPKLASNSIDKLVVQDFLSTLDDRTTIYLPRLISAVKSGGSIFVIDFYKTGAPGFLPLATRLDATIAVAEFFLFGYRIANVYDTLPLQFFLEFKR